MYENVEPGLTIGYSPRCSQFVIHQTAYTVKSHATWLTVVFQLYWCICSCVLWHLVLLFLNPSASSFTVDERGSTCLHHSVHRSVTAVLVQVTAKDRSVPAVTCSVEVSSSEPSTFVIVLAIPVPRGLFTCTHAGPTQN